jgi:hypothetical protein
MPASYPAAWRTVNPSFDEGNKREFGFVNQSGEGSPIYSKPIPLLRDKLFNRLPQIINRKDDTPLRIM